MTNHPSLEEIDTSVNIPTLPAIVGKINELMEKPESSASDIGKVVAQDAPIASKVLRIVNSAHYGLRREITSLDSACAVLGTRVLRNIVMQASVINQFKSVGAIAGFKIEDLWRHSILCAQIAQAAASLSSASLGLAPDEFYACALLHDLGQVVLLDSRADEYAQAVQTSRSEQRSIHEVERETFGFTHADVGARIAFRWKLPTGVVNAVQYHHGPRDEIEADPSVALIFVVSHLCSDVIKGETDMAGTCVDDGLLIELGLNDDEIQSLVELAVERLATIEI